MDPIADMLNTVKNASLARKETVVVNYSKQKESIAQCLMREGYLATVEKKIRHSFPVLVLSLVSSATTPKITNVKRISKPSRRMYAGVREFRAFTPGHGILVLSTPKGVLSHKEAKKELVGGELLFSLS